MSTQPNLFWQRWLIVVTIGTLLFGLSFMLLPGLMQTFFNLLLFGSPDAGGRFDTEATRYILFTYGILGAVMVGWMIGFLLVLTGPFRRGEQLGWNIITYSMTIWFVIDSAFSLISGFAANAALNVAFFILFAIPLAATYRHFYPAALSSDAVKA
jgi:hypothetical protein